MPGPRPCSPPSICNCTREKSRCCRSLRGLCGQTRSRWRSRPAICSPAFLNLKLSQVSLHGENPDRTALRHLRILTGENQVHAGLHLGGVDAPAGLNRDVLLAVDLKRNRYRRNPGACREFPKDLAGLGIEGAEQAIVGAAREQKPAAGSEQGAPVEGRQVGRPYLLAGVEVPGLQLA